MLIDTHGTRASTERTLNTLLHALPRGLIDGVLAQASSDGQTASFVEAVVRFRPNPDGQFSASAERRRLSTKLQ